MQITTVGLDLAKNVFHVVCFDENRQEVRKRALRRNQVRGFFANLPACRVGMEACATAHYWARELRALGHEAYLIPPQHVAPYRRGNKHDYNDARAIAEALERPGQRFVPAKDMERQDVQSLHRLRAQCIKQRTALANSTRGLLAEYGITLAKKVNTLRRRLPELLEEADNGLSTLLRQGLAEVYEQLCELDAHEAFYTTQLTAYARQNPLCQRLQSIPGVGPLVASALVAAFGDGSAFGRGREMAAALGLVPGQHSSGGKARMLGITKRGDRYLRALLVHGARAALRQTARKDDRLSRWAQRLVAERGWNKATVALANKLTRIAWALLHTGESYRAEPSPA
jgi:transposase